MQCYMQLHAALIKNYGPKFVYIWAKTHMGWGKEKKCCVFYQVMEKKDFFLRFNLTIAFEIRVLGIPRALLVKLLRLCSIYHSPTCVMFQTPERRGYSWRQLVLCWAAIKDNISYLLKESAEPSKSEKNVKVTKMPSIKNKTWVPVICNNVWT